MVRWPRPSGRGLGDDCHRPAWGEGNTSNAKALGEGVSELRIDRGPGYRVYFGWDGKVLVILLGGGTKKRQQNDIQAAQRHWRSYKARKAAGRAGRK